MSSTARWQKTKRKPFPLEGVAGPPFSVSGPLLRGFLSTPFLFQPKVSWGQSYIGLGSTLAADGAETDPGRWKQGWGGMRVRWGGGGGGTSSSSFSSEEL